jgi:thiol-disulfide isomerase/thioredoxin
MLGGAGVALVLVIVGVIIAVGVSGKKTKTTGNPVVPASSAVTAALAKAAAVTAAPANFSAVTGPPSRLTGTALTGTDGKPEVLYVGAEWCPYCAVTRWPLTVALSRFGTFTNLQTTKSASDDVNPNTPTLSYYGASYTSSYIDFVPVEVQDGSHHTLETLTSAQSDLFESIAGGTFPFVDFGGKWTQKEAGANPAVLAGLTPDAVAAQLSNSTSTIGSSVQQGADVFSAIICGLDGGKPAAVCTSPAVTAATAALATIK